jgi:hypothetical protein
MNTFSSFVWLRIPFHSWMCGLEPTIRIPTTQYDHAHTARTRAHPVVHCHLLELIPHGRDVLRRITPTARVVVVVPFRASVRTAAPPPTGRPSTAGPIPSTQHLQERAWHWGTAGWETLDPCTMLVWTMLCACQRSVLLRRRVVINSRLSARLVQGSAIHKTHARTMHAPHTHHTRTTHAPHTHHTRTTHAPHTHHTRTTHAQHYMAKATLSCAAHSLQHESQKHHTHTHTP